MIFWREKKPSKEKSLLRWEKEDIIGNGKQVREFASPCEVSTGDGEAMFRTPSARGRLQREGIASGVSCTKG